MSVAFFMIKKIMLLDNKLLDNENMSLAKTFYQTKVLFDTIPPLKREDWDYNIELKL